MNYSNPRVDEISAEIGATIDPDVRRELSRESQQILTDEVAAIYLAETNRMIATREEIEGCVVDPNPLLKYWPLYRTE